MKEFFKKIHLSVVDAKYLVSQASNAKTKSVFLFFLLFFMLSLAISSATRTAKITKQVPDILVSAVGVLKFEDNKLVSPDTIKIIDNWRLKELGTLISGMRVPQAVTYPIQVSIGTDSINTTQNPFVHIGKTAFSTNILSALFSKNPDEVQSVAWNKILPSKNIVADANFYITQLSNPANKINIFFAGLIIIGIEMTSAILQIWIAILIYLVFFGRNLNIFGRLRLIMLTTIPYFILMPVSLAAANGISFTTDIALVCGLIMTIRAVTQLDLNSAKETGNGKK